MRVPWVLFVLLCAVCFLGDLSAAAPDQSAGGKKITLSAKADLSALDVAKTSGTKSAAPGESLTFHLDPAEILAFPSEEGYDYLSVGDLAPTGKPGEPQLPMKTYVIALEKGTEVKGVEVVKGEYSYIQEKLNIVPVPQPISWSNGPGGAFVPDKQVYSQNTLFPKKLISYEVGSDNEHTYVYVRLHPVQYNPVKKEAVVVTDATINVYYATSNEYSVTTNAAMEMVSAESVIICPASLANEAESLRVFHEREGMTSAVVTTDSINSAYAAAEDPAYAGYNNSKLSGYRSIRNYNYLLAKKIVSYLRDMNAHPNLKYVTLLGDGLLVPPSYYFYDSAQGTAYDNWAPTDYFYTSPDYDYTPNFRVGRLPVSDAAEASSMVNKVTSWWEYADWSTFRKAYLIGGKNDVTDPICHGEKTPSILNNLEYLSGMCVGRCFHTDGTFNADCVKSALSTESVGMAFVHTHGSGQSWSVDSTGTLTGAVSSSDILAYPPNPQAPIVTSVSCLNGAADLDLVSRSFPTSLGEALLKSKAGGIAYLGTSRLGWGSGLSYYEGGNLIVGRTWYSSGLNINCFRSYHEGAATLGDILYGAESTYVQENIISADVLHMQQLFTFGLLGDPALKIPVQQPSANEYRQAKITAVSPAGYDTKNIPFYYGIPVETTADTDSPTVVWKLIHTPTDTVVYHGQPTSNLSFATSEAALGFYQLRTMTENPAEPGGYFKDNWFFYNLAGQANKMHIGSITMVLKTSGRYKYAVATVKVVDSADSPVAGAQVNGQWSGLAGNAAAGTTDSIGQVMLNSNTVSKTATGTFTLCVKNIALTGWIYDASANATTCNTI